MATHKATVTANVGPGRSLSGSVITGVTEFHVLPDSKILQLNIGGRLFDVDLNGVTTFTVSISSGSYSITIS